MLQQNRSPSPRVRDDRPEAGETIAAGTPRREAAGNEDLTRRESRVEFPFVEIELKEEQ